MDIVKEIKVETVNLLKFKIDEFKLKNKHQI